MSKAALCAGFAAPIVKGAGIVVAGRLDPAYSHTAQAISELSARGAPGAALHRASTIATGILQVSFAYGLWRTRERALACVYATIGVAAFGGAAFPCSPGCPPPGSENATRSDKLHNAFGFPGGAALIAAPVIGASLANTSRAYRRSTIVLATATGLSGSAALFGLTGARKGAWQRAFQTFSHTWQIIATGTLLRRGSRAA